MWRGSLSFGAVGKRIHSGSCSMAGWKIRVEDAQGDELRDQLDWTANGSGWKTEKEMEDPAKLSRVGRGRAQPKVEGYRSSLFRSVKRVHISTIRSRFPHPLHSFRTVGFPQYGWKQVFPDKSFRLDAFGLSFACRIRLGLFYFRRFVAAFAAIASPSHSCADLPTGPSLGKRLFCPFASIATTT